MRIDVRGELPFGNAIVRKLLEPRKQTLVIAPAVPRSAVEPFPDLPDAVGFDQPAILLEVENFGVPFEAKELEDPP